MAQSLLQITLNMNRRRRSLRSEVSSEAIDLLSVLIEKPEFAIPGQEAYRCDVFEPGGCSESLWAALHARAAFLNLKIKTQLESALPRSLWLGVLLEPRLLPGYLAMAWLEDFARCLSWAVLDRAQSRAGSGLGWVN